MYIGFHCIPTGSITFGLVNIPAKLYTATDTSKAISFNQLDGKGHRIRYKRWCPVEDREVSYDERRKGYEIAKGHYVVFEKQGIEKIAVESTITINVRVRR